MSLLIIQYISSIIIEDEVLSELEATASNFRFFQQLPLTSSIHSCQNVNCIAYHKIHKHLIIKIIEILFSPQYDMYIYLQLFFFFP